MLQLLSHLQQLLSYLLSEVIIHLILLFCLCLLWLPLYLEHGVVFLCFALDAEVVHVLLKLLKARWDLLVFPLAIEPLNHAWKHHLAVFEFISNLLQYLRPLQVLLGGRSTSYHATLLILLGSNPLPLLLQPLQLTRWIAGILKKWTHVPILPVQSLLLTGLVKQEHLTGDVLHRHVFPPPSWMWMRSAATVDVLL